LSGSEYDKRSSSFSTCRSRSSAFSLSNVMIQEAHRNSQNVSALAHLLYLRALLRICALRTLTRTQAHTHLLIERRHDIGDAQICKSHRRHLEKFILVALYEWFVVTNGLVEFDRLKSPLPR
jgi:hypothetical protein